MIDGRFAKPYVALLTAVLLLVIPTAVWAAPRFFSFEIDRQPLATALVAFGRASGVQLIVESYLLENVETAGITGDFAIPAALAKLLEGSDLAFSIRRGGVISIIRPEPDQSDKFEPYLEELVVIGARSRGLGIGGVTPVTIIDVNNARRLGQGGLEAPLFDLPSSTAVVTPGISNILSIGAGFNLVDLRNLGINRTLILMNGRRLVNTGIEPPIGQGANLSTISLDLLERIEVLTGSASALYGSEAIAGVINLVSRKNIDGIELFAQGGISERGDYAQGRISMLGGGIFADGRLHLIGGYTFAHTGKVEQRDREFSAMPQTIVDGTVVDSGSRISMSGLITGYQNAAGEFNFLRINGEQGELFVLPDGSDTEVYTGTANQIFNFADFQQLVNPVTRHLANLDARYNLNPGHELFLEYSFSYIDSESRLAPSPLGRSFGHEINVPLTNPLIPDAIRATISSLSNGQATSLVLSKRMFSAPPRSSINRHLSNRVVVGVEGELGAKWTYELYGLQGWSNSRDLDFGGILLDRARIAADPDLCAQNAADGCVLINYLGQNTLSTEQLNYIRTEDPLQRTLKSSLTVASLSAEGPLVDVPAGPIGLAVGLEYNRNSTHDLPDPIVIAGNKAGILGIREARGAVSAIEAYGEAVIPLLHDVWGVNHLAIETAIRYSDFSTVGGITNWKFGIDYRPIDIIRFSVMYQKGVRAPNIMENFAFPVVASIGFIDPCAALQPDTFINIVNNCQSNTRLGDPNGQLQEGLRSVAALIKGNTNLDAERSQSLTLNLVFTPQSGPWTFHGDLYIAVSAFAVEVENPILIPRFQVAINRCFSSLNLSGPFCAEGFTPDGPLFERNPLTREIEAIHLTPINGGSLTAMGFDFELGYNLPMAQIWRRLTGTLNIDARYALNDAEELQLVKGDAIFDLSSGLHRPKHRVTARFAYSSDNVFVAWTFKYRSSGFVDATSPDRDLQRAASAFYNDFAFGMKLTEAVRLRLGIDNVLDHQPSILPSAKNGTNTFPQFYDVIGRRFWLGISATF